MKDDMKIEMEAGRNIQLDHIKEIMKENIPAFIQENQNLKAELYKAIKQLKDYEKALKEYAKYEPCEIYLRGEENPDGTIPMKKEIVWTGKLALETLKKWEE